MKTDHDETQEKAVGDAITRLDETLNALGYSFVLSIVNRNTGQPHRLACRGTDSEIILAVHECDCFWRSLRVPEITRFREERTAMIAERVAKEKENSDD